MMFGAVLVIALSLVSIRNAFVSAVALEQTARCGAEEHRHTAMCYEKDRLQCGKSEHTHNRNCYLVLLKDNDINSLLSYIDRDRTHNLESLIYRTVDTAIQYNTDLAVVNRDVNPLAENITLPNATEAAPQPTVQSAAQPDSAASSVQDVNISQLNNTIAEQEIEPNIVLNENLYNAAVLSTGPSDTAVLLAAPGASTFAVGDSPNPNDGFANFYINLDGSWVCIGTTELKIGSSQNWFTTYYTYLSTNDILTLINGALGTSYTRNNLRLSWHTSASATNNWRTVQLGQDTTRFGENYYREDDATAARYIRIVGTNGNAIRFYTVTFRYEDGTTEKMYVRTGTQITLPDGKWKTGNTPTTAEQPIRSMQPPHSKAKSPPSTR